jgi:hypothetical protein
MFFASPLRSLYFQHKRAHFPELGLLILTPAAPRLGKTLQNNVREDAAEVRH